MALNDPFFTFSRDRFSDVGAHVRLRHPAVQDVDPLLFTAVNHGFHFFRVVAFQPLRAETDLADLQAGFSQISVPHISNSFLFFKA